VVTIRERRPADDAAIGSLNELAFGGLYESRLAGELRAEGRAAIELVAEESNGVIGHILFNRLDVTLDGRIVRALALAPMSVRPELQRQGVGSALVRRGIVLARERNWQAAIVLGHRQYYPRFGFSAALAGKLRAPFKGPTFMALELERDSLAGLSGQVRYPAAFGLAGQSRLPPSHEACATPR
jgi:putative acetyltransferase